MMSTGTILIVIVAAVAALLVIWGIVTHNSLIARRNRVRQCRSGICVVLKQRNDLIPNLVASVKAYMGHENELLTRIPELKANAQFLHLQGQIEEMENELQAIRRTYNAAVTDYNNAIEMFPSSIIASWGRHTQEALIEIPDPEKQAASVAELFRS